LSNAVGHFGDIMAVTAFLLIIFGVMGIQIYGGAMRQQCLWKEMGRL